MHILPQLRKLEAQFGPELVVVGVHAGKFHAERETENIRLAARRLEVEHPVVNDRQFRTWRSYAVSAWPTLVFIDPAGRVIGSHAGESPAEVLAEVVQGVVEDSDAQGLMGRTPVDFQPARAEPARPLAFPGKVLAAPRGRLFIADSNNNRILAVRLDEDGSHGTVESIVGGEQAGFADGKFDVAGFHRPQGLALVGDILYVADTENHAIRAIDWQARRVTTVAGTGEQARFGTTGGPGTRTALNSPWDVLAHNGMLYVAMAGSHQLWRLDLRQGRVLPYAGTGGERLFDGPLSNAALAQPSGLATDGQRLYFADSEASAVRSADFHLRGTVGTLVGTGLFDFGDADGTGKDVLLQHPLSVACWEGKLYVADTYNNKIKVLDPATRAVTTFLGTGEAGDRDGDGDVATFYEPGGISVAEDRLYVADTNNHRVRMVDLRTGRVSRLALEGLE